MKIKNEIQYEKVVSCKIVQDNTEQGMPDSTAETIMVTSIGTYRDTIYSTALTMIENEGTTLSKTVKFASSLGIALPFTAIGIAMDSKNEGAVQATITGLLTTGAVVAISFVAIGILPSTIPAAIAVGILSGFSNYIIGKMFDNIYDFSENLYWNWKYEQETKKLIIETSETDISDIKTMVDFIVNTKDTKKHLYNIEIKQNKNGETIIYTIQPSP